MDERHAGGTIRRRVRDGAVAAMIEISNLRLPLDDGADSAGVGARKAIARAIGVRAGDIDSPVLLKRSVDARKKSDVHFVASYAFSLGSEAAERAALERGCRPPARMREHVAYEGYSIEPLAAAPDMRPIVVGSGPAGLFATWALAKAGARPLLVERGQRVEERLEAVGRFNEGGALDPESNIQFGEGGAGTFSDGKLTTNIKNPRCKDVLHIFAAAGAPEEILWQAKPHIGTDLLVDVVRRLRRDVVAWGGEVRFDTRLDGMVFSDDGLSEVLLTDVRSGAHEHVRASRAVLACGHSARDTFVMVRDAGLKMERKPFSVGVRIEHDQKAVDRAQYGSAARHSAIGAADYKLAVHLEGGRGVYTFCMCPGGEVVCAASEEGGVCVNGMSRFARDGRNANSAVLVGVDDADLAGDDVFAGIDLQRSMERAAFREAGGDYKAPAQRVGDFLARRRGGDASGAFARNGVDPTYARGVVWCDLHEVLPAFVSRALEQALPLLDRRLHGFAASDAVMTGVETRSSSPVRIVRDKARFEALFADDASCSMRTGVYPCGEGAGYAGGIMSAAVDGLRVAEALLAEYRANA